MNLSNDQILRQSLTLAQTAIQERIKELGTFKNFGMNVEPLEIVYDFIDALFKELLDQPDILKFHEEMKKLAEQMASVVIVITGADPEAVKQAMGETFKDFDGQSFDDLINAVNKHTSAKASTKVADNYVDPQNKAEDVMEMLDLEAKNKKGSKKKKKPATEESDGSQKPVLGQSIDNIFDKFNNE